MFNVPVVQFLLASVIAGVIGMSGFMLGTQVAQLPVTVYLDPNSGTKVTGETFVVSVRLKSDIPVNAFRGFIQFDSTKLTVDSIDYNTSIADLWAEEPWYSNGDGTINFTGGTTVRNGFVGEGSLVTITFTTTKAGEAVIALKNIEVLQHDGLGTEAMLDIPIDSIFTIESMASHETVYDTGGVESSLLVTSKEKSRDLNGDGKQSIADISIFMSDIVSKNTRSDFNEDGLVNLKDLSILTQ